MSLEGVSNVVCCMAGVVVKLHRYNAIQNANYLTDALQLSFYLVLSSDEFWKYKLNLQMFRTIIQFWKT